MPTIEFQPSGARIDVAPGTELVDAARAAGVAIDIPCGGNGTCGKCLVRIVSGDLNQKKRAEGDDPRLALACQCAIGNDDVVVETFEHHLPAGDRDEDIAEYASAIATVLRSGRHAPIVQRTALTVPPPRPDDGHSDFDRLKAEIIKQTGKKSVIVPLAVIRALPELLRADDGMVIITWHDIETRAIVIRVEPAAFAAGSYGIAVDVGTTTVAVALVDLATNAIVAVRSGYNDQIPCGLDVISRINYARRPVRLEDLRGRVVGTINRLLEEIRSKRRVDADAIVAGSLAGNTVMTHLLLGIVPEHLRLEPYTPALLAAPNLSARDAGIAINPDARLFLSPAVGSYVGGDITAGVLMTPLTGDAEGVSLFLDVGTNGELVIGGRDFLIACACSAGPAFEGGGIDCGMRAADGAIDRVRIADDDLPEFTTIGGASPRGICGSGIIDLIAGLFSKGIIDSSGKFDRSGTNPRIRIDGRRAEYVIESASSSATGADIAISELDIDNVMRAKAAIYSACALMLKQVGMSFTDLERFYIAGGFGRYLNIENAITIGLLPDLPVDRFAYLGNASLIGSTLALVSKDERERISRSARRMTYVNLSTELDYMDQYTAALFLPHTDRERFPNVYARLNAKKR
ncbi:MAG TPA: ASKHA domain-containing protein [Spirochaetota bacterium]|nr:ASKHA domain-containing protein [Spirochaetota bacterium]HPU87765.1 ASKHA domain-containing protein [Spirochaetota bacterium]